MRHAADPDFWATESLFQNYEQLAIPVLHITGWYDGSLVAELELFEAMRRLEGVEAPHYLVVGPWDHPGTSDPSRTLEPLDFGAGAVVDIRQLHARWFDYWLRGRKAEKLSSSVRIFAMGLDQWSDHGDWPTSDTSRLELYLHSGGDANSSSGGGTLDVRPPGLEDDDTYLYDPSDPTPSAPSVEAFVRASGPLDYLERSFVESRRDVLVYTTAPLETPITLIGAPVVELCSSSDAVDTDFGASLGYVGSDGRSIILAEGLLRTSFSESASSLESALPGSPGVYRIVLNPTCRQVLTGERIRVCIYSAAFPAYDRNPNTGGVVGRDEVQQLAHQRVRHSRGAVSKVVLRIGHIVGGRTTFAAGQEEWPWLRGRATLPGPTIESETAGG